MTVVGVMPNLRYEELSDPNAESAAIFTPLAQSPQPNVFILGRTRGAPIAVTAEVRRAVAEVDPDLPLRFPRTLRRALEVDTWFVDVFGGLFVMFGVVALGLSAIGLYAVVAFSVAQRTRELAIRIAIGANPWQVRRAVMIGSAVQVAIGVLLGLGLATMLAQMLGAILIDVEASDPLVFAAVPAILAVIALLAAAVPAWRASRLQPLRGLG